MEAQNSTGVVRVTSTAPIERAHSDRARSGSREVILTTPSSPLIPPRRRARDEGPGGGSGLDCAHSPTFPFPATGKDVISVGWPDGTLLRATFSPAQPRARRDALLSQASTVSSCAFCEQEGWSGGSLSHPSEAARCASRRTFPPTRPQITPSNAASPYPHSTRYSCPIPPPPLSPSPHTSPPGERQSGAPAQPTKWQNGADF